MLIFIYNCNIEECNGICIKLSCKLRSLLVEYFVSRYIVLHYIAVDQFEKKTGKLHGRREDNLGGLDWEGGKLW